MLNFTALKSRAIRNPFLQVRSYIKYAYQDQIYLHPIDKSKTLVSLSKNPEAIPLGHIPEEAQDTTEVTINTFTPNPQFLPLLHDTISSKVINDFSFVMDAGANAATFMPIYDFRNPPPYGRIPEVDDVFGYVHVNEEGKMVDGTYEHNPMYRLCNSTGLLKLSDFLLENIRKECESPVK